MFERARGGERTLLVHVGFPGSDDGEDLGELAELVRSAGAAVVGEVAAARKTPDPRFFVGSGKVEEIRQRAAEVGAEVVVFDRALSPAQERNLEGSLNCRVLDRISLILDIFAQRASSFEGKLQVELAQLQRLSTRLVRGWTHLERQKGGIGLRGPGEKQLETDRRLVAERIKHINRRLERVERRRGNSRRSRDKARVPIVALVGYTNAGKSTLFNALTGADVVAEDRLFATLDPKLRRMNGGDGARTVLVDTVGFVRDLPHELVAAFRATLEETREAQLLLHVIDATDPLRDAKIGQVNQVLAEIGAGGVPQLEVFNKLDKLDGADAVSSEGLDDPIATRVDRDEHGRPRRVWVSAARNLGLGALTEAMKGAMHDGMVRERIRLPIHAGRLRARVFEVSRVVSEHPGDDGEWVMEVEIEESALERLYRSEGLVVTRCR